MPRDPALKRRATLTPSLRDGSRGGGVAVPGVETPGYPSGVAPRREQGRRYGCPGVDAGLPSTIAPRRRELGPSRSDAVRVARPFKAGYRDATTRGRLRRGVTP